MLQPFVAVGLRLKDYGHRVRLATHEPHRSFVEQFGLEFYPLGGDPQILADFAVQSKGASPDSFHTPEISLNSSSIHSSLFSGLPQSIFPM